ncbi:MAG: AfsA-related hotdog domain-containing protein [Rhodoferax sp.]
MEYFTERYFVVGDTFSGTARRLPEILTETEALEKIGSASHLSGSIWFYAQQGVDLRSLSAAVEDFNSNTDAGARLHLVTPSCAPRATKRLAHKARAENILISAPRRIGEDSFEMDLCFSSQNEFFLDHMTGMHIQGMVLMEAARQAFLAVTEAFFLRSETSDYYFVVKRMDAAYTNFVFPFDARLRYDITRSSIKQGRYGFEADITILQADVVCTTVKVAFTAFETDTIAAKEHGVALECYSRLLASYAGTQVATAAAADSGVLV